MTTLAVDGYDLELISAANSSKVSSMFSVWDDIASPRTKSERFESDVIECRLLAALGYGAAPSDSMTLVALMESDIFREQDFRRNSLRRLPAKSSKHRFTASRS